MLYFMAAIGLGCQGSKKRHGNQCVLAIDVEIIAGSEPWVMTYIRNILARYSGSKHIWYNGDEYTTHSPVSLV